jgi:hypothetical protein
MFMKYLVWVNFNAYYNIYNDLIMVIYLSLAAPPTNIIFQNFELFDPYEQSFTLIEGSFTSHFVAS